MLTTTTFFNSISWIWAHQVEVHLEFCGRKLAEHKRYLSGSKYYYTFYSLPVKYFLISICLSTRHKYLLVSFKYLFNYLPGLPAVAGGPNSGRPYKTNLDQGEWGTLSPATTAAAYLDRLRFSSLYLFKGQLITQNFPNSAS